MTEINITVKNDVSMKTDVIKDNSYDVKFVSANTKDINNDATNVKNLSTNTTNAGVKNLSTNTTNAGVKNFSTNALTVIKDDNTMKNTVNNTIKNKFSTVDKIKIFTMVYFSHKNKKTTSKEYIDTMKELDAINFDITLVPDVSKMINNIDKSKNLKSYEITMLIFLKNKTKKLLVNISKKYYNTEIENLEKLLKHKIFIMNAFTKIYICDMFNSTSSQMGYYNSTRTELINRLDQLRDFFSIDALVKFGIKKITYNEIVNMNLDELCNYYNDTISTILSGVILQYRQCGAYREILYNITKFR